jgi:hypothetical protein
MTSMGPRTVRRSAIASGIFGDFLSLKSDHYIVTVYSLVPLPPVT